MQGFLLEGCGVGEFDPKADVDDLLSMSDCAMLWGNGETSHSNPLKPGNTTQLNTLDGSTSTPIDHPVSFERTGFDLDRFFANRRLLGLLLGQDQVRVEQLERGESRVYYC